MKKHIFYVFIIILTASCTNNATVYNDPIPTHDSLRIKSKFTNEERVINIWTPPNYDTSKDSLTVIYMPDGGIKEDFPHIANTLDTLIKQNKIPNVILVGIENTERGRDLTGPSNIEYDLKFIQNPGGADNFRKFIKSELFPVIDRKYRTSNKKVIIGESLAGLFVIETFILEPNMFDYFIAMDPSLWFNENYLVKNYENLTKDNNYENKKLWYAGSSVTDISTFTKRLNLKLKNTKGELMWKYEDEPNEKHNTIFRATKKKAFTWIFSKNK